MPPSEPLPSDPRARHKKPSAADTEGATSKTTDSQGFGDLQPLAGPSGPSSNPRTGATRGAFIARTTTTPSARTCPRP